MIGFFYMGVSGTPSRLIQNWHKLTPPLGESNPFQSTVAALHSRSIVALTSQRHWHFQCLIIVTNDAARQAISFWRARQQPYQWQARPKKQSPIVTGEARQSPIAPPQSMILFIWHWQLSAVNIPCWLCGYLNALYWWRLTRWQT